MTISTQRQRDNIELLQRRHNIVVHMRIIFYRTSTVPIIIIYIHNRIILQKVLLLKKNICLRALRPFMPYYNIIIY